MTAALREGEIEAVEARQALEKSLAPRPGAGVLAYGGRGKPLESKVPKEPRPRWPFGAPPQRRPCRPILQLAATLFALSLGTFRIVFDRRGDSPSGPSSESLSKRGAPPKMIAISGDLRHDRHREAARDNKGVFLVQSPSSGRNGESAQWELRALSLAFARSLSPTRRQGVPMAGLAGSGLARPAFLF